jgi:oligosaccharide repeat unit polymerase
LLKITSRHQAIISNHSLAFLLPWLIILFFSTLDISEYYRPVSFETYLLVIEFIIFYLLGSSVINIKNSYIDKFDNKYINIAYFFAIFLMLTALNIILAGYIPLIMLITDGDSNYGNFGISGLYGLYLAFTNFLGLLCFYNYKVTKKFKYIILLIIILFVLILFVTRQNIVSLLFEIMIINIIFSKKIKTSKVLLYLLFLFVIFSIIGDYRTPEIASIARIKDDWNWLPNTVIWLYSYSYFNLLNLDVLVNSKIPSYDGSMFFSLIPNFIKPSLGILEPKELFLETYSFGVSSAITDLYSDFGFFSVAFFSFVYGFLASLSYSKWIKYSDIRFLFMYCVLYFCAAFSFFINFWFYLPIIFQLFFIFIFLKVNKTH